MRREREREQKRKKRDKQITLLRLLYKYPYVALLRHTDFPFAIGIWPGGDSICLDCARSPFGAQFIRLSCAYCVLSDAGIEWLTIDS